MNNLNQQPPRIATGDELRPLLDTLQSMEKWALDSIAYVNPRSHLSFHQKCFVRERINRRITHLQQRISELQDSTFEAQVAALDDDIQQALIGQAEFNRYAWFYEFPRYPLPEGIEQPFSFDLDLASEEKGNIERLLYYGDDLQLDTVSALSMLTPDSTVLVTYRFDYKNPREQVIGYVRRLDGNTLFLQTRLSESRQPDWSISLNDVVHIHRTRFLNRNGSHK